MADVQWLDVDLLRDVLEAVRTSRICRNPVDRDALLMGIPAGYRDYLPTHSAGQSILSVVQDDLDRLNVQDSVDPGVVPLQVWLMNAFRRCEAAGLRQKSVFERALREMSAVWKGEPPPGESLKITGQPDYLPVDWFTRLLEISPAVAYVETPVYRNERPVMKPSGEPATGGGTGWLIGKRHLITNHHVINARDRGLADEADLRLQAAGSHVYFDYTAQGQRGEPVGVESLCIWRSLAEPHTLDYAVLKLAEAPGEAPLAIAQSPDSLAGEGQPANIVQHPRRKAKQVGVRNNEIRRWDDDYIYYHTDTEPGSSGSPVCNDAWQVVGLHRAGHNAEGLNAGVRIDRITADVQQRDPALWDEIGAELV